MPDRLVAASYKVNVYAYDQTGVDEINKALATHGNVLFSLEISTIQALTKILPAAILEDVEVVAEEIE